MGERESNIEHIEAALSILGWSGNRLAEQCGVTPKTVSAWRTGKVKVPGSVVSYLSLAMRVKGFAADALG